MWQGWIALIDGMWLTLCSFMWQAQSNLNLLLTGLILIVFGFWSNKSIAGIILGFLGIWLAAAGCTNYLNLSVNYLLTGLTIIPIAMFCATFNLRAKLLSKMQ